MSIKRVIICDACGSTTSTEESAFSVLVQQADNEKKIAITRGIGNGQNSHVCGSECLLKFISTNLVCL